MNASGPSQLSRFLVAKYELEGFTALFNKYDRSEGGARSAS